MGRWIFTLAGLLVWGLHFLGVYTLASLEAVSSAQVPWRQIMFGFSLVCLAATGALAMIAFRRVRGSRKTPQPDRLMDQVACLGAAFSAVAIVFQTLPLII